MDHKSSPEIPLLELGRLSLREHDVGYLIQRLARAFSRRPAVSAWGLQYRLCETGPAKLDPRLLTAALQRLSGSHRSPSRPLPGLFTDPTLEPGAESDVVATSLAAADLVRKATGDLKSVQIARAFGIHRQKRPDRPDDRQKDTSTKISTAYRRIVDDIQLEVHSIKTATEGRAAMHTWILNDLRWLYPDDPRLWRLLRARALTGANVLIIARKIAPITFHLFKALGVRGVQFYSLLCESEPSTTARNAADTLGLPHLLSLKKLRTHAVIRQIQACTKALTDLRANEISPPAKDAMTSAERNGFGNQASPSATDLLNWTRETELEWPPAWSQTLLAWAHRGTLPLSVDEDELEHLHINLDDSTPIHPTPTNDEWGLSGEGDSDQNLVLDRATTVVSRGRIAAEVDRATWDRLRAQLRKSND